MQIMSSESVAVCFRALLFIVVAASPLHAQSFGHLGERAQGMGDAFVAVADDASAIYWNPAGLSNIYKFDAQAGLTNPSTNSATTNGLQLIRTAFAGAAMPALGVAYYRVQAAVRVPGSRQNGGSGEVRVSSVTTGNAGVSIVQSIVNTVVVGSTLRAVRASGQTAFEIDAGGLASVGEVRLGITGRNLRGALGLARQVRVGAAIAPRSLPMGVYGPFTVAFDADLTCQLVGMTYRREIAVGSEQWWMKGLAGTRFGARWNTINPGAPAVSGGLTMRLTPSTFVEGHVTKGSTSGDSGWGLGGRLTF